ncbi:flagellar basal body-associated FliL family protein [Leeia sp. TBRC 13508]|uniref:Flagellar protein FliL n=1 Tax=Leeia speluncae TaxID=2884804 RepID=A0ABS8D5T6_9NEIS|nr:flagellar basal body-associated FliL family protein [Leeia speluncae]MCB6183569.1 flagellar basal body-associated FliL family protein [Leeia speluncae]
MKKIIIIVVALLVVAGGVGGGVWFFMSKQHPAKPAGEKAAKAEEGDAEAEAKADEGDAADEEEGDHEKKPPVFYKIDRFVVNVDGDPEKRGVMSVEVQAELADAKKQEKMEAYKPKIQSELILLFGAQKFGELSTPEGKTKLLEEVRDKINEVIGASSPKKGAKSVAFTSLILEER